MRWFGGRTASKGKVLLVAMLNALHIEFEDFDKSLLVFEGDKVVRRLGAMLRAVKGIL